MTKKRLIASLLIYNGNVIQTRKFKRTNMVGSAVVAVDFFNGWTVDEIMALDISNDDCFRARFLDILEHLSKRCFVPLTVGGKVDSIDVVKAYTRAGADKVVVNTAGVENPKLLGQISDNYGSQCLVVSIDCKANQDQPSGYEVIIDNGRRSTGADALDWAKEAVSLGAGELMINNVDHDGDKRGYDLGLVKLMAESVGVPVIAFGGVGKWQDLVDGINIGKAEAVAAGNIFHYSEHSTKKAKEFMAEAGVPVRYSTFYYINRPRMPKYERYLHEGR